MKQEWGVKGEGFTKLMAKLTMPAPGNTIKRNGNSVARKRWPKVDLK